MGPGFPNIAAIVLAAGEARRFGSPKQLANLAGRPLIVWVLEKVLSCGFGEVIVVLGHRALEVMGALGKYGLLGRVRVVINWDYGRGLSSSLKVGVRALGDGFEAFMVILADQPLVKARTLCSIAEAYVEKRPLMVVPTHGGARGNPVLISRELVGEVMGLEGDVGARVLIDKYRPWALFLEVDDPGILIDVDTVSDLEEVAKMHHLLNSP